MKETTNYSLFKDISSNREVDKTHVKSLVNAIQNKNLLYANPILVNEDMEVIDGQHRLEAARILGVPIYYIQADVSRQDISKLNSNQKNWKLIDYINFWAVEKAPNFNKFTKFLVEHSEFGITGLITIVNIDSAKNTRGIKRGEINIMDMDFATEICELCRDLNDQYDYDFVFDGPFVIALKKVMNAENFSLDTLKEKIAAAPRAFVPCRNVKEYTQMIMDAYNYKLSKKQIVVK